MNPTPLIGAAQLQQAMAGDEPLVVIDTGFDLADTAAGERQWREAHIRGAFYLHLDRDLSAAKTGSNGRHPLPDRPTFAATIGALGITPATQVIVYDRQQGMVAARAWWMLRWLGHAAVAVLDGGLAAWQAAGGALDSAPPVARPAPPYPLREPLVGTVDAAALASSLGRVTLVDARAGERFRGEVEPLDAQAGHIPGALNRFFKDNLAADGRFKAPELLRAEFERLGVAPGERVVHQCGSGVTACHNLLAMDVAGWGPTALYPGSWSEWSSDPARPVARG
ncbi:MAG TPA: sulfurtransferase [Albitalea sp.]|nr:sulfurtransferase [Albitalea sp.]